MVKIEKKIFTSSKVPIWHGGNFVFANQYLNSFYSFVPVIMDHLTTSNIGISFNPIIRNYSYKFGSIIVVHINNGRHIFAAHVFHESVIILKVIVLLL